MVLETGERVLREVVLIRERRQFVWQIWQNEDFGLMDNSLNSNLTIWIVLVRMNVTLQKWIKYGNLDHEAFSSGTRHVRCVDFWLVVTPVCLEWLSNYWESFATNVFKSF